jgi:MFS family permease
VIATLRSRDFALLWTAGLISVAGDFALLIALPLHAYALTGSAVATGGDFAASLLPQVLLGSVAGVFVDRWDRKRTMVAADLLRAALLLPLLAVGSPDQLWLLYLVRAATGIGGLIFDPAESALLPRLVGEERLVTANALNALNNNIGRLVGPVAGGLLYGISAEAAYGAAFASFLIAAGLIVLVPKPPQKTTREPATLSTVIAGFRYIWRQKIVFGAISLDLFAVLFGGATAMMPIFASEVLHVGPVGYGMLRAAPGVGAAFIAAVLAFSPIQRNVGRWMFSGVAVFGVSTVVFGLSTIFWVSLVALILLGAGDMISVFVRHLLVQLETPDSIRGRVSAVSSMFIGASNELGEAESGLAAAWLGLVPSVVLGGLATLLVVGVYTRVFPELRRMNEFPRHS